MTSRNRFLFFVSCRCCWLLFTEADFIANSCQKNRLIDFTMGMNVVKTTRRGEKKGEKILHSTDIAIAGRFNYKFMASDWTNNWKNMSVIFGRQSSYVSRRIQNKSSAFGSDKVSHCSSFQPYLTCLHSDDSLEFIPQATVSRSPPRRSTCPLACTKTNLLISLPEKKYCHDDIHEYVSRGLSPSFCASWLMFNQIVLLIIRLLIRLPKSRSNIEYQTKENVVQLVVIRILAATSLIR